jgi:alpha-L-rhamnosidase
MTDAREREAEAPPQWNARFVTASEVLAPRAAAYFRGTIEVAETPVRAVLFSTAVGLIEPYLNGERIGDEVLAPGWTSYRHRLQVSSWDVTGEVVAGANVLGAIAGEGWAVGDVGYESRRSVWSDRFAVYLQLDLEYADGRRESLGTGESFRWNTGALVSSGLYAGEVYDARRELIGWSEPGFDDSDWASAVLFEWDTAALIPRAADPIRRVEHLAPRVVTMSPSGKTIVDFGQIITGWVKIAVTGAAGDQVTLRHAELLTPAGELERFTLRRADATDTYILGGEGTEVWEPRFSFHGFRYVEVDGWPGELNPSDISAVVVHSDMRRTGWFETSSEMLNQFHRNTVWSMRGNFVGVPTDCPQRDERLGWTGDINAFAPTAAFLYDVRSVLGSWVADLLVEQSDRGFVPWVVPDVLRQPSSPTALWGDVVISLPWNLYLEYGDVAILAEAYPGMVRFAEQVEGMLDEDGVWARGYQFGDWLDPDAPPSKPAAGKTDAHLVATAYLAKTAAELARVAELLGNGDDSERWKQLTQRTRTAFRAHYVTATGRIVSDSATAYALAIRFGLLDPTQLRVAGNRLAELVREAGFTISTGFAGTQHVAPALTETGHLEEAYRLLMETRSPSFMYPVTQGATTIWERWDAVRPDGTLHPSGMTSLNHYAFGAVCEWMHSTIGGLTALEPGYRRARIAPQPGGGLTSATVRHETVHGLVAVAWRITDGEMVVDVTVPEGTSAVVELPLHPHGEKIEVEAGEHSWSYPAPKGWGAPMLDLDSPLELIKQNEKVWARVSQAFRTYFPGLPMDEGASTDMGSASLSDVVTMLAGAPQEFRDVLAAAFAEQ